MVRGTERTTYSGDIVIVACGALSSALLMLRSANDDHPHGLANGSGLVGRNYMRHNNSVVMAISRTPNPTKFQKTLGLNDFYFGSDDWDYPLGHIQMVGKSDGVQIRGEGLPAIPAMVSGKAVRLDRAAFARLLADLRGFAAAAEPDLLRWGARDARSD